MPDRGGRRPSSDEAAGRRTSRATTPWRRWLFIVIDGRGEGEPPRQPLGHEPVLRLAGLARVVSITRAAKGIEGIRIPASNHRVFETRLC